ncbi:hypothetical protein II906_10955, partial [bacterium]|nr:hypothetical protein [bacterium]
MLIQGTCNTDKTALLIKKYADLVKEGVPQKEILVVLLNAYKKNLFISEIKKLGLEIDKNAKIYTFFGLCYNSFLDNWGYISELIQADSNIPPNLCGLEVSQYIFKQCIKEADFSDYISKVNLLHQLFRRYSLIVQNCLDSKEVIKRSKILNETFAIDAQKAIEEYKKLSIKYRSFDYLRQMAILPEIYSKTDYFKQIKYFIADDADEFSYAFYRFIETLIPYLTDYYIGYDKDGSSRAGYLCAYKSGINEIKSRYNPKETDLKDKNPYFSFATDFSEAIRNNKKINIDNIDYSNKIKRLDMFDNVISDIQKLITSGVKPSEISVITPLCDNILTNFFIDNKFGIKFNILSGSEKLADNDLIKYIIGILKLSYGIKTQDFELKNIFIRLLNIPYKSCYKYINEYSQNNKLEVFETGNKEYDYKIQKLVSIINSLVKSPSSISEKIKIIFTNIIKEFCSDINQGKYDFLYKEAFSFEAAFSGTSEEIGKEFIIQIENSVISENPSEVIELNKESILIGTPQKIIDNSYKTKYQFWLDISNSEWTKEDTGTLYNSWVLNRDWNKNEYTLEDNIILTNDKTARIIRKLILLSQNKIKLYSSLYDNANNENFGGITEFIKKEELTKKVF